MFIEKAELNYNTISIEELRTVNESTFV